MPRLPAKEYCEDLIYEIERRAKCCTHYDPLSRVRHDNDTGCERGVPIEAKAIRANGQSRFGIGLRLPCNAADDPLFSCPWYSPHGIDQARDDMIALREAGRRTLETLARQLREKSVS